MEEDRMIFTNKFSNKILTKYLAGEYQGLFYFEINEELVEQIKVMRELAIIGSGHIVAFLSVQSTLTDRIICVNFIPNFSPDYLTSQKSILDTFYNDHAVWYVDKFEVEKLDADIVIPCEGVFLEVQTDSFSINVSPYENKYFNVMAWSYKIGFGSIGL